MSQAWSKSVQVARNIGQGTSARTSPAFRKGQPAWKNRGSRLPHIFDHWDSISQRLRDARHVHLLLDFDGTLADLRPRPEQVRLRASVRKTLCRLAQHPSVAITVISGRRRETLRRLMPIPRGTVMGLYGWEDTENCRVHPRTARALTQARVALAGLVSELPEVRLEDKAFTLAVHFRGCPLQTRRRAKIRIGRVIAQATPCLRLIRARELWEVVPRQVRGKAIAVRKVLRRSPKKALPIYLGDDLSDEPAFALLDHGVPILVGPPRQTQARFRLRGPKEVFQFLKRLEAELP